MSRSDVLLLPGLGNSNADHWQSSWESSYPYMRRVVQADWDNPRLDEWLVALQKSIAACETPPILVAHSLACALVAHWANRYDDKIHAALMVAPADVDSPKHTPDIVRNFSPIPLEPLRFPSIVAASSNDVYVGLQRAKFFAKCWNSRFVNLGAVGHVNHESQLGDWPFGMELLASLS